MAGFSESHVVAPGKPVPASTYRVQLHAGFDFAALGEQADYLSSLGASHAYMSPILQAAPGSMHGYDVVDHAKLSDDLGGAEGFASLRAQLGEAGLGAVVDVVPNHMAVPTPASINAAFWSVLRLGPASPYARWFDVDWSVSDNAILMPVLGQRIGECLDAGEIVLDRSGPEPVLQYHAHTFPIRPGTEELSLEQLLDRQWYRLAYWRVADEELNYRRFFDVDTLAGLRVEDPAVFAETHALLLALHVEGGIDGLRIDHPDGLADPRGYLRQLAAATGGAWVVVEKILEGEETLPADWPCAGTTGYDAGLRLGGLFRDGEGEQPLVTLYSQLTGEPGDFASVVEEAKRYVVAHSLYAEIHRLVEVCADICSRDMHLRDHTRRAMHEALVELLVAMPVYRAYVVPGEEPPESSVRTIETATDVAHSRLPEERHATLAVVRDLVLGRLGRDRRRDDFCRRFQQTCGPVMAKGLEDTAFYRWFPFSAANEVGGDPGQLAVPVAEFHEWSAALQRDWPLAMTTLSTHDTKRSEDIRARLATISEDPAHWAAAVTSWRALAARHRSPEGWPDANMEYLLWQTLVGAWPLTADRLSGYLEKASREAKRQTSWTEPDQAYDAGLRAFAQGALADEAIRTQVEEYVRSLDPAFRCNVLGQKLVQLMMPGVPDVYQGTECLELSLVDPDNRRPVDYAARRAMLKRLDDGAVALGVNAEKLLVTSRSLRLRRRHPDLFGAHATYLALEAESEHVVAFARSDAVVTLATRLPVGLARHGGWGSATVRIAAGPWTDLLSGRTYEGGDLPLRSVLSNLPVALLVRPDLVRTSS